MKQGSIKTTETRNDGITAQLSEKSLHWHACYKFLKVKVGIFSLSYASFLVIACSYTMSAVQLFYQVDCCIRGEFNSRLLLHELKPRQRGHGRHLVFFTKANLSVLKIKSMLLIIKRKHNYDQSLKAWLHLLPGKCHQQPAVVCQKKSMHLSNTLLKIIAMKNLNCSKANELSDCRTVVRLV